MENKQDKKDNGCSSTSDEQPIQASRISIAEAALRLGKSQQFVRMGLQHGVLPFGFAVKTSSKYSYHISPKKLEEYIGL